MSIRHSSRFILYLNTFIFNFLFELLQLPAQLHALLSVRQNDMLTMIS